MTHVPVHEFRSASTRFDAGAKTRAAIALAVAEAGGRGHSLSARTQAARRAGLSELEIASARIGVASEPKLAAMVGLARRLADARGELPLSQLARLREVGVSLEEIAETMANAVVA